MHESRPTPEEARRPRRIPAHDVVLPVLALSRSDRAGSLRTGVVGASDLRPSRFGRAPARPGSAARHLQPPPSLLDRADALVALLERAGARALRGALAAVGDARIRIALLVAALVLTVLPFVGEALYLRTRTVIDVPPPTTPGSVIVRAADGRRPA